MFKEWLAAVRQPSKLFLQKRPKENEWFFAIKYWLIGFSIVGLATIGYESVFSEPNSCFGIFGPFSLLDCVSRVLSDFLNVLVFGIGGALISHSVIFFIAKRFGGKASWKQHFALAGFVSAPLLILKAFVSLIAFGFVIITIVNAGSSYSIALSQTVNLVDYAGAMVRMALGIVGLVLLTFGLRNAHGFSLSRAFAAWLLPALVLVVGALVLFPNYDTLSTVSGWLGGSAGFDERLIGGLFG